MYIEYVCVYRCIGVCTAREPCSGPSPSLNVASGDHPQLPQASFTFRKKYLELHPEPFPCLPPSPSRPQANAQASLLITVVAA